MSSSRDISGLPDEVGVTALCCFHEEVYTPAGRVIPNQEGFHLHLGNRKPERFATAASAVGKLRRHTDKNPRRAPSSGLPLEISP